MLDLQIQLQMEQYSTYLLLICNDRLIKYDNGHYSSSLWIR